MSSSTRWDGKRSFGISNAGWRIISSFFLVLTAFVPLTFAASSSYESALKEWTREKEEYSLDNLEMKLKWHATYLSVDYRKARHEKLLSLLGWPPSEADEHARQDQGELARYDDFIVSIYAGSSADRSADKDTGHWRFLLDADETKALPVSVERMSVSKKEKILYPYLDPWSDLYRVRFPRTIREGKPFTLRMSGIPAKSELAWN